MLPTGLGKISTLEVLALGNSFLSGSIPTELGLLSLLQRLDLNTNAPLTGPIPTQLGALTALEFLNLATNKFAGAIPTALGNIKTLQEVFLGANLLTGAVPAELCAVAADTTLQLATLVVDCGAGNATAGAPAVTCAVPDCCSSCTP